MASMATASGRLAMPYYARLAPRNYAPIALFAQRSGRLNYKAALNSRFRTKSVGDAIYLAAAAAFLPASSLFFPTPAIAVAAEDVAAVLTKAENVYLQALAALRAACNVALMFLNHMYSIIEVGLSTLFPSFKSILSVAIQLVKNIIGGFILPTERFLQFIGINTAPAVEAVKTISLAVEEASKQIIKALNLLLSKSTFQTIHGLDMLYVARAAGLIAIIYFLVPVVISSTVSAIKGYKGELSALQVLDMVLKRDYILIDVRTEKEKSKSGIPGLPRNATSNLLFVPIEDLSFKFKGQLRDYRKAEAEVAAIKISYLRRINNSSKLVILDSYGDVAKSVAKSLHRLGLKKSWVVKDGFDGGRGWVQSRLSTASTGSSIAQILSPSRIISEGAKKIFPSSKDSEEAARQSKKLLPPGGKDDT